MSACARSAAAPPVGSGAPSAPPVRIGVVSFVNTLPLIDGLERLADVELRPSVPSRLVDLLLADEIEVGLCSSIDYQRAPEPLVILPAGVLGCDGPTLTVRLYSSVPLERLTRVHCDTDSHASVALMQILLAERFGAPRTRCIAFGGDPNRSRSRLETPDPCGAVEPVALHPCDTDSDPSPGAKRPGDDLIEAVLLIGDKVVTDSPPADRFPHQLDLGEAWHEMTGLPFVFALWMAKRSADERRLAVAAAVLDRQRRHNRERIDWIVHHRTPARNWPGDLARQYLKRRINFDLTARHIDALERFFDLAATHGLIDAVRPVELWRR